MHLVNSSGVSTRSTVYLRSISSSVSSRSNDSWRQCKY